MSVANGIKEMIKNLRDLAAHVEGLEAQVEHWKKMSGQDNMVQQQINQLRSDIIAVQQQNDMLKGRIKTYKATLRANGIPEPVDN